MEKSEQAAQSPYLLVRYVTTDVVSAGVIAPFTSTISAMSPVRD